jgi:hypothetical protein
LRRIRPRVVGFAIAAGLFIIAIVMMYGYPAAPWTKSASPLETAPDALQRRHEYLVRFDRDYPERLKTLQRFSGASAEKTVQAVLAAAREQLAAAGKEGAADAAAAELTRLAAPLSSDAGRAGIPIGPIMSPEVLDARVRDAQLRQRIRSRVYDFQKAACVFDLLREPE